MEFHYPATEIFSPEGDRRVVWSEEEYAAAIAEGFTSEPPAEPSPELLSEAPKAKRGKGVIQP